MFERKVDHCIVESIVLAVLLLLLGHVFALITLIIAYGDELVPIGGLTVVFSCIWAIIACGASLVALLLQVVVLNGEMRSHVAMLKEVRWEATALLQSIKVAQGESPDFLPHGGAFDNPKVRDPKKSAEYADELRNADYVLERFISLEEHHGGGGWLKIYGARRRATTAPPRVPAHARPRAAASAGAAPLGVAMASREPRWPHAGVGVSTARVAAFFSVSGSIMAWFTVNFVSWLTPQITRAW